MAISEIRMPDETEGTEASLAKWLKGAGDQVSEHEPLVEISTDKVTMEVAAPASGTIRELLKQPGDAVVAGELLGTIDALGDAGDEGQAPSRAAEASGAERGAAGSGSHREQNDEERTTYSPAVRKLLAELGLDPARIPKVGRGGRFTPDDIGAYLKHAQGDNDPAEAAKDPQAAEAAREQVGVRRVPHTPMRKSIAGHMARSVQTAPHVTAVFEADLSNVLRDREARKRASGGERVPSVTAYLIRAAVEAIRLVPEVNSKWHEGYLEVFESVNFGVGTALESGGLVVPVIRDAHAMDLAAISEKLNELTNKARAGKLTQADMQGGTFTLSNHGVSGSLLAAPIILPYGQAAILGAGKMQKRVIVCETGGRELFRVRPMMYVTLTVDHRVLDGQQTNGFLTAFVAELERPIAAAGSTPVTA